MNRYFMLLFLLGLHLSAHAEEQFTATIEIGSVSSNLNTSNVVSKFSSLSPSSSFDNQASALLFSFSYVLDEYLSIGSDFVTAGSVTASESGTSSKLFDTDTVSVYAKVRKKITENATLYGKLGAHMWALSENQTVPGGLDDGVDITYGIGANIDLYGGSNRQFNIQWNHYEYNGVYVENQDLISLGILFIF